MGTVPAVAVTTISEADAEILASMAADLAATYPAPDAPELRAVLPELVRDLPAGLHESLTAQHAAASIVRGLSMHDDLPQTPPSWEHVGQVPAFGYLMAIVAAALGEPFGWAGQQDGRLVNSIIPARGHEQLQTGASSSTLLSPHTEDAFHADRAHLIILGCLRNRDRIGTTLASVRDAIDHGLTAGILDEVDIAFLRQPECPILPDDSYVGSDTGRPPAPVPTLWEREDGTCLRFDPAYTPVDGGRTAWQRAYQRLSAALDAVSMTVNLNPGEILILDNDVAVHGRVPFTARFDGTDRWLLRLNIRDPRRERPVLEAYEHGFGQQTVRPFHDRSADRRDGVAS